MSVLGYNTIGASDKNSIGYIYGSKFTPTENGTIDDIVVYQATAQVFHSVCVAMYSDNAGSPDTLLAYSGTQAGTGSAAWLTFSSLTEVSSGDLDIANGTPIWLVAWTDNNGSDVKWKTDAGSTNQGAIILNGTYPTFTGTITSFATEDLKMSIYANYTAAGGGTKKLALLGVG